MLARRRRAPGSSSRARLQNGRLLPPAASGTPKIRAPIPPGGVGGTSGGTHVCRSFPGGRQGLSGRRARRVGHGPGDRRRRVRRPGGAFGLRQDDRAPHARRPRDHHRGHHHHRRPGGERRGPQGPGHRHGVPELRPLPPPHRLRQHRLRAAPAQDPEGRDRQASAARGRGARARGLPRSQAAGALRRPAPAGRHGTRHRARAAGVPHGRAALQPGRQAARADARRDQQPAATSWA